MNSGSRLTKDFYIRDVLSVAPDLIGKQFVTRSDDNTYKRLKITEVEAYRGAEDRACHASKGRTKRTEVMYHDGGRIYVYFIYGLYYCLNVTAGDVPGKPEAVLLRAIEPVAGEDIMAKRRQLAEGKNANLTNGPSKLCMAMGISKRQNKAAITTPPIYINDAPAPEEAIVETTRIGVDYAGEWKNRNWRFYLKENLFVSKK